MSEHSKQGRYRVEHKKRSLISPSKSHVLFWHSQTHMKNYCYLFTCGDMIFLSGGNPYKACTAIYIIKFFLNCLQHEYVFAFKQSRRREDDIAIVNTCMRVLLENDLCNSLWKIKDCTFSFGGMAPTTVMAVETIRALIGRYCNQQ